MPAPNFLAGNLTGEVTLKDNPYQKAFLNARRLRLEDGSRAFNRFVLIAGRRGGKTRIGAVAGIEEAAVANTLGWACAPSYPELHDYVLPAIMKTVPAGWITDWHATNHELVLKNRSKIQFRSLDDPERGRGPGLHWAWLDETRKISKLAWDTLRPALADYRGAAYFTTSPNGFDWCYHHLWMRAKEGHPGYWGVRYKTSDNPAISAEEIEEARASMDPTFFQQEFEADFVSFTGAIYASLLEQQILTTDDQIRAVLPEWPRIDQSRMAMSAVDPGSDHPFAGVLALVTEQGLVCFNEFLSRNLTMADYAIGVREMERPFIVERRGYDQSAKQWAIELGQHGLWCQPAEHDVIGGIQRVQSWLKQRQLWFIAPRVPKLIAQMRSYRWNENFGLFGEASRKERVFKKDDDLPDALRYLCMLYPELPKAARPFEGRDPRTVPEEARWAWERLARIERGEKEEGHDWNEFAASEFFDPVFGASQDADPFEHFYL